MAHPGTRRRNAGRADSEECDRSRLGIETTYGRAGDRLCQPVADPNPSQSVFESPGSCESVRLSSQSDRPLSSQYNLHRRTARDNRKPDPGRLPVVQTFECVLRRPTRPRYRHHAHADWFHSYRPTGTRTTLPRPIETERASSLQSETLHVD